MSGEAVVMASTTIGVDRTHRVHPERVLFAGWDPCCLWIRGQNDSNLGCRVRYCNWRASYGAYTGGEICCLLSRWAAHHLRIRRLHHPNLGCGDWYCSRKSSQIASALCRVSWLISRCAAQLIRILRL